MVRNLHIKIKNQKVSGRKVEWFQGRLLHWIVILLTQKWNTVFVRFCLQTEPLFKNHNWEFRVFTPSPSWNMLTPSIHLLALQTTDDIFGSSLLSSLISFYSSWRIHQIVRGENCPVLTGLLDSRDLAAMATPNSCFCVLCFTACIAESLAAFFCVDS